MYMRSQQKVSQLSQQKSQMGMLYGPKSQSTQEAYSASVSNFHWNELGAILDQISEKQIKNRIGVK